MVAKRTLREIRRMSDLTNVILDTAKRLGPGNGRHSAFMAALGRLQEFKALPSWRKAYLQGYSEGASAILALDAAGVLNKTPIAAEKIERTERPSRLPPRPTPEIEPTERLPARSSQTKRAAARAPEVEMPPDAPVPDVDGEEDVDAMLTAAISRLVKKALADTVQDAVGTKARAGRQ